MHHATMHIRPSTFPRVCPGKHVPARLAHARCNLAAPLVALACALLAACAAVALFAVPARAHATEQEQIPQEMPLLMIVVGFEGDAGRNGSGQAAAYDSTYDWSDALFGEGDSLATYYRDMSDGLFTFAPAGETSAYGQDGNYNEADTQGDGVIHVTLPQPHGAWGLVNEKEDVTQDFGKAVIAAFREASPYIDFSVFDANGDGLLTTDELAVVVCVAGFDASPYADPDRTDIPVMWPHTGILANKGTDGEKADGVELDSYIAIAEFLSDDVERPEQTDHEPVGIICHELGHHLGLPDLYPLNANPEDAPWGAYRTGPLSLMDNGGWCQVPDPSGAQGLVGRPMALDAWSRYVLGWATPQIAAESGDYVVSSQLSDAGYSSLLIPTTDPTQYYLLENRQPEGLDEAISVEFERGNARGGIVVWQIDKDIYRQFGRPNESNDTTHAPAVMEAFWEESDGRYSTDWPNSTPRTLEPFYDAAACEENLGDALVSIDLPLYRGENGGTPESREFSNVTVQFPSASARDMTVHVELPSEVIARSKSAYTFKAADKLAFCLGKCPLAAIACHALAVDAGADASIVDAGSIAGGLPKGKVTYKDAFSVLPADENMICYFLTGAQIVELAESSVDQAAPYVRVAQALEALRKLDIGEYVPSIDDVDVSMDGALAFGGVSFDVDWNGVPGARTANVLFDGQEIDLQSTYYVAMTPGVARKHALFDDLNPDPYLLWGSPADGLRSYLQLPDWEKAAAAL